MKHRQSLLARTFFLLVLFGIAHCHLAIAQNGRKEHAAGPSHRHGPFQGKIDLWVTATDTNHQIFVVRETVPIQMPGPLKLLYPEWEPGSHAPTASVAELAGLMVQANGQKIEWRRDPIQTHSFHIEVPSGARAINIEFEFLAPRSAELLRPEVVDVQWHRLLLYPAHSALKNIRIQARLTLPEGLKPFTALDVAKTEGNTLTFAPTTLDTLVDAPVYAGRFWLQRDLGEDDSARVRLDVLANRRDQLNVPADELKKMRDMIVQATLVFGNAPFRHYDAIVTLNGMDDGGIEHTEEGEDNLPADYLTDLSHQLMKRDLIVHEYVHAWDGRFRQPADLGSPNLNEPVRDTMLWVYEGQTEFWGRVLAARAGLRSYRETLDRLAMDAALVANRKGRAWKSLADSNNDPLYMAGHPVAWRDWQRREDYYSEGVLLWLDVDARLRELSRGYRSLDDFAHLFFATHGAVNATSIYTFRDVCNALNVVAKDDWPDMLRRHLESHSDDDAMAGLARAGWRLHYDDQPTETFRQDEAESEVSNLDYSIGLQVHPDGSVRSVVWNGPAFIAGLAPGARITAVNGQPFSLATLEQVVRAAKSSTLSLTMEVNGAAQISVVDYHAGLRYPHLKRVPGTVDWLSPLLAPRK